MIHLIACHNQSVMSMPLVDGTASASASLQRNIIRRQSFTVLLTVFVMRSDLVPFGRFDTVWASAPEASFY